MHVRFPRRRRYVLSLPLPFIILIVLFLVERSNSMSSEEDDEFKFPGEKEKDNDDDYFKDYLYAGYDEGVTDPIQDYETKEDERKLSDNATTFERPDFLFSRSQGHRIVEFYAPWCPHCQHFKKHYVEFARTVSKMAAKSNQHIDFHAVSCTAHRLLCQDYGIHGYPKLYYLKRGSINGTRVDAWDVHPFHALQSLGITAETLQLSSGVDGSTVSLGNHHRRKEGDDSVRTQNDIYNDAFLSFDFSLRNSVFIANGPLPEKVNKTFVEWIELLHDTLPPTWKIHNMINAIRENMEEVTKDEKKLFEVIEPHSPKKKKWSYSCSHGDRVAGYTCGLWELFHIMTVGLVEWNSLVSDEWAIITTMDAAENLRGFIAYHFECLVCQTNFLNAYDSCAHTRCDRLTDNTGNRADWIEFPLWLWETHNAVNVRLLKEHSRSVSHQDELNAEWPQRDECPRCWRADGTWDDEMVFKFLRLEYWPEDATSREYRKQLFQEYTEKESGIKYDEPRGVASSWLLLVAAISPFIMFGGWVYLQKVAKERIGRHKKN